MKMNARSAVAAVAAIAIALTSFSISPAVAASSRASSPAAAPRGTLPDVTDVSSARRRTYRSGNRAALGAFLGIAGTIAGIAAAEHYRRHAYDYGYYPYYDDPPYPYYGPRYYYVPRYHYYPRYYRYYRGW